MRQGRLEPLMRPIILGQTEIELVRQLVRAYMLDLDILVEPSYNQIVRKCNTLLKTLEPYPDMRSC